MEQRSNDKIFLYATFLLLALIYSCLFFNIAFSSASRVLKLANAYIITCNLLAFYRCSLLDPGFINENKFPNFELQPLYFKDTVEIIPDALENTRNIHITASDGSTKTYVQKYCTTCNIFRPYMAAHCNDCGRCVLEKDHHCLWISNCVGRNNSKVFLCFIFTLSILDVYCAILFGELFKLEKRIYFLVPITVLFLIFTVVGLFIVTFSFYNIFIACINVKSRVFINSPGKVRYEIDFKRIYKDLCTLKPVILSERGTV